MNETNEMQQPGFMQGAESYIRAALVEYLFRDYDGDKDIVDALLVSRHRTEPFSSELSALAKKNMLHEDFNRYRMFRKGGMKPQFSTEEYRFIIRAAQYWCNNTTNELDMVRVSSEDGLRRYLGLSKDDITPLNKLRRTAENRQNIDGLRMVSEMDLNQIILGRR